MAASMRLITTIIIAAALQPSPDEESRRWSERPALPGCGWKNSKRLVPHGTAGNLGLRRRAHYPALRQRAGRGRQYHE